jgi:hypothetical protein
VIGTNWPNPDIFPLYALIVMTCFALYLLPAILDRPAMSTAAAC